MVFITKKIQFKNCLAAAMSFHVHLKLTILRFLEPTILLHRQGLSNFTFLLNQAPLGESVKDENLVGRWLRIRERFIWLLGADGDAVAGVMGWSWVPLAASADDNDVKVTVTTLTVTYCESSPTPTRNCER